MFSPTQMGQIYLIFNQLPFLWDTSEKISRIKIASFFVTIQTAYFEWLLYCGRLSNGIYYGLVTSA